jgi:hypothetical protein
MKAFKITSVAAIAGILLLAVVFQSSAQTEIFRVNHDSTEITFAGQKYIKQKTDMKNNNGIVTEIYPDGSIKSVSKDGISVFRQDVNGNIGIGNGGHDAYLHIYSGSGNVGLSNGIPCPSEKLIVSPDSSSIIVEPVPVGKSKPMKLLNVSTKDFLNNR